MKDPKDTQTIDLVGETKRPGRKRKYANNAERQRAYRARKKAENAGKGLEVAQDVALNYVLHKLEDAPEWVVEALESLRPKRRSAGQDN